MYVCIHVCICMWRFKFNVGCLSTLLSILFIEAKFLDAPGDRQFCLFWVSSLSQVLYLPSAGVVDYSACLAFTQVLRIQLLVHVHGPHHFIQWAIFPAPFYLQLDICHFLNKVMILQQFNLFLSLPHFVLLFPCLTSVLFINATRNGYSNYFPRYVSYFFEDVTKYRDQKQLIKESVCFGLQLQRIRGGMTPGGRRGDRRRELRDRVFSHRRGVQRELEVGQGCTLSKATISNMATYVLLRASVSRFHILRRQCHLLGTKCLLHLPVGDGSLSNPHRLQSEQHIQTNEMQSKYQDPADLPSGQTLRGFAKM